MTQAQKGQRCPTCGYALPGYGLRIRYTITERGKAYLRELKAKT